MTVCHAMQIRMAGELFGLTATVASGRRLVTPVRDRRGPRTARRPSTRTTQATRAKRASVLRVVRQRHCGKVTEGVARPTPRDVT
jgi:hypothetical protein